MSNGEESPGARQAAEWFALLLDENVTQQDLQRFRDWLDQDAAHARAYARIEQLWGEAGMVPGLSQHSVSRRKLLKAGGAAVVLSGLGIGAYRLALPVADYSTGTGEMASVALPDRSRMRLSTATAVSVDFTDSVRVLHLLSGEAFFEVEADSRPFTVIAGKLRATALGTAFSVSRTSDRSEIVVLEHAVRVEGGKRNLRVGAGQMVSFAGDHLSDVSAVDTEARLSWLEGRLVFISTPLSVVVKELEKWRRGRIIVTDEELGRRPVTLIFDVSRAELIPDLLRQGLSARVETWTPWLTLIRPL